MNSLFADFMKGIKRESESSATEEGVQQPTEQPVSNHKHRENQVRSISEISHAISSERNLDVMLPKVVNLIKNRFNLYYVGVFILDESGSEAILREGTGFEGQAMLEDSYSLPIDDTSMIGWAVYHRMPRIALDVETESIHLENPYLPETRSELAFPLIRADQVLGAVTIQSEVVNAFTDEDITIFQGIVNTLSVALMNEILSQRAESGQQEIRRLHQQYMLDSWKEEYKRSGKLRFEYKNPDWATLSSIRNAPSHQITVPITLRNQVIGKITLDVNKPQFTPDEEFLINAVANQAALALENTRLIEITQRSTQQERILSDLSRKVWASSDIETIMRTALSEMVQTLQASDGIINLDISEAS
jgi:GAF domain-containing protein